MNLGFPPESTQHLSRIASGFPSGAAVILALAVLTTSSLASGSSAAQVEQSPPLSIPEPASMILGLFGLCLILLRRGRL